MERNKAPLSDFHQIYEGSQVYNDLDFPHSEASLYWADSGESESDIANMIAPYVNWGRVTDEFPTRTLFGAGITPGDVAQGLNDSCYLVAALAAMAEVPGRIERVFLNENNELSQNGIYGVTMYTLGMPHTVLIDDWLPLVPQKKNSRGETHTTVFANFD